MKKLELKQKTASKQSHLVKNYLSLSANIYTISSNTGMTEVTTFLSALHSFNNQKLKFFYVMHRNPVLEPLDRLQKIT